MAEYVDTISRQAAIDAASYECGELRGVFGRIEERLKALPSAQPKIIRCKDCINWDTTWTNDFSPDYHYCPIVDGVRKDDFFCADAERRTDFCSYGERRGDAE